MILMTPMTPMTPMIPMIPMIPLTNVHPLTDFKRHTAAFRTRLRKTGEPAVLTVDGRAALVVQDAAAYERLLAALDVAETTAAVRRGLEDVDAGRTVPADRFFAEMRSRLKLPAKPRKRARP